MDILLIDDEADVRTSLSSFIQKLGHQVTMAEDGNDGLNKFMQHTFDLVITDIRMPGIDGIELLRQIKQSRNQVLEVIIITGHGDMDSAVDALRHGAYNYLQKPIDVRELAVTIQRCEDLCLLRSRYLDLKTNFDERVSAELSQFISSADVFKSAYLKEVGLDNLKYCSAKMQAVIELAERFSRDRTVPVLIEGESGTGKELIARLIHYFTMGVETQPFVAINCGAIAPELFEGELFGHEAGAYTGASSKGRRGKLAAADNGTLFLDEIGELLPAMQVKLLRVLEERRYYPVGSAEERSVDVRILSATNKNLQQEVANGKFRLDLYHRLNVGKIVIPPLRERPDDILLLAHHFIKRSCSRYGRRFECFTAKAEQTLKQAPWPGNVRQLKNAMMRMALVSPTGCFDVRDLSFVEEESPLSGPASAFELSMDISSFRFPDEGFDFEAFTDAIIQQALALNGGNQTKTAEYLGLSRRVLQGKLKKNKKS